MLTKSDLSEFRGSLNLYQNPLWDLYCTEGISFLVKNGAFWLVNAIASYQYELTRAKNSKYYEQWEELKKYQLWILSVPGKKEETEEPKLKVVLRRNVQAVLTCWHSWPSSDFTLKYKKQYQAFRSRNWTPEKPVIIQDFDYTNFPLAEIAILVMDKVMMLPSER